MSIYLYDSADKARELETLIAQFNLKLDSNPDDSDSDSDDSDDDDDDSDSDDSKVINNAIIYEESIIAVRAAKTFLAYLEKKDLPYNGIYLNSSVGYIIYTNNYDLHKALDSQLERINHYYDQYSKIEPSIPKKDSQILSNLGAPPSVSYGRFSLTCYSQQKSRYYGLGIRPCLRT